MKVAIYARESSDDPNKAPPIAAQIERAKEWAAKEGHEITGTYADDGMSGGNWSRPEWQKVVSDARARQFSLIVVWAQDRLARDTEQFLWFYRNISERGVKLHSLTEGPIDMETLGGRMQHTTMAVSSEVFRLITSEKVKKAYAYKKQKAKEDGAALRWGRKEIPEELRKEAIRIKEQNPELGNRKIAEMLPEYQLKNGKLRKPSYVWVAKVLQGVKKTPPQNSPASPSENPGKEEGLGNHSIV